MHSSLSSTSFNLTTNEVEFVVESTPPSLFQLTFQLENFPAESLLQRKSARANPLGAVPVVFSVSKNSQSLVSGLSKVMLLLSGEAVGVGYLITQPLF